MDPTRSSHERLVRVLQRLVSQHNRAVLTTFGLLALLCAGFATQVRIDTSVDTLLLEGDPDRDLTEALRHEFSNDASVILAFDLGREFQAEDLEKLRRISEAVAEIDGIEEVLDLSNIEDVRGDEERLDASPLVDFSQLNGNIEAIRTRTRDHRLYRNNLISDELDVFCMVAIFEVFPKELRIKHNHKVTDAVLDLVHREGPPWIVYASGFPVAEYEANRIVPRDFTLLTVTALLLIALILFMATRRAFSLILLLVLVLWAELVTNGWLGLSGTPISPVLSALPSIVIATASAYVIYLVGLLSRVSDRREHAAALISLLTRPVLLSGLSTAIGFVSLRFIPVPVIGQLGTALAVSVAATVSGTLLLLPAMINRFDWRLRSQHLGLLIPFATLGVRWARRPVRVLTIAALIASISIPGLGRIIFDTDVLNQFGPETNIRISDDFIRDRISGAFGVSLVLRSDRPDGALDPAILRLANESREWIERYPVPAHSVSFVDYIYLMDKALRPGEAPRAVLPSHELAAQYMLLYEAGGDPQDMRHYINHDRSALRIFVRNSSTSIKALRFNNALHDFAEQNRPEGVEVHALGNSHLFNKAMDTIAPGLVRGLFVALVLIGVVMLTLLRSFKLALIAAIPNLLPLLICGGFLGWAGIYLSMGTSIVGCLVLGLAVDDTAHVIGHIDGSRSLEEIYALVGRPLILTTLALGLGFSTLLMSEFESVAILGAGTAITLVVALLCDLLVLPSLLVLAGYGKGSESATPVSVSRETHAA